MDDWKNRLYDSYVSTGQADRLDESINLEDPYYHKYFSRLIARHLPASTGIAIVDLACGNGRLLYSLKKYGYTNVFGIDISKEQVAVAHHFGLTEVQCQDMNTFLAHAAAESFDVVFLMDILEHLEKPELLHLLDRVHKIIKSHGTLVMHVPNGAGINGMRVRYGDFTHHCAFTQQSMQQIVRACNFDNIQCYEEKLVIHGLKSCIRAILWQILTFPARLLLTIESGPGKYILSQNMLVVARKSPAHSFPDGRVVQRERGA